MQRLLDLSFRFKLPIWGGLLILVSVAAVSAALMFKAYDDLGEDVRSSAEGLGGILVKTLFPLLLHDDVWHAFEQVNAAFHGRKPGNPVQPEAIFVVNEARQIMVSSRPETLPMTAGLAELGADYARLGQALEVEGTKTGEREFAMENRVFFTFPIREESAQVGVLVIAYSRDVILPRFQGLALSGLIIGGLILAVLLPLNWYWGWRMAAPLADLAGRMGAAVRGGPHAQPREPYRYNDELGQLFQAYDALLEELRQKALLEREVVQAERLAAIGRLASGMAHEVNNPLGGMLMALDTLRERGGLPPHAGKTMDMLERGLKQIQETVGALLVQTRDQYRSLTPHDLEDVRTLIHPQVLKKSQRLDWRVDLPVTSDIPAAACRQVLINLLLNAVQATTEGGRVAMEARRAAGGVWFRVVNEAPPIPPQRMQHLFEPFVGGREEGHGLGLWMTYQIVQQLQGSITAECAQGEVVFEVWLPSQENPS
jgi:signal transduction histidine kinase